MKTAFSPFARHSSPFRFFTDHLPTGEKRFELRALFGVLIAFTASSMLCGTGQADDETSSEERSRSIVFEPAVDEPSRPRVVWGMERNEAFRRAAGRHPVESRIDVSPPWDPETETYPGTQVFKSEGSLRIPHRKGTVRFSGKFGDDTITVTARVQKVDWHNYKRRRGSGTRRQGQIRYRGPGVNGIIRSTSEWFDGRPCRLHIRYWYYLRRAYVFASFHTVSSSNRVPSGEASISAILKRPRNLSSLDD